MFQGPEAEFRRLWCFSLGHRPCGGPAGLEQYNCVHPQGSCCTIPRSSSALSPNEEQVNPSHLGVRRTLTGYVLKALRSILIPLKHLGTRKDASEIKQDHCK